MRTQIQHWVYGLATFHVAFLAGVILLPSLRESPDSVHKFVLGLANWQRMGFIFGLCVLYAYTMFKLFSPEHVRLRYGLFPNLADRLKLDQNNPRTIFFTTKEIEPIRENAEAAPHRPLGGTTCAKRVVLPKASVSDIPTIPGEPFAKFQTGFYSAPRDAAFQNIGSGVRICNSE